MNHSRLRDQRWQQVDRRFRELEPVLHRYGVIVQKGAQKSPFWYLRYNDYETGSRVQKSIYLGTDPFLVEYARRLLYHFRQLDQWDRDLAIAAGKLRLLLAVLKRPERERTTGH